MLLGKKIEKDLIRNGEQTAMVSGLFSDLEDDEIAYLSDYGVNIDEDGSVLIQRNVSRDGKSQIKINGRAVSMAVLKAISPTLIFKPIGFAKNGISNSLS
jgi:DNA repair protein RecN (Recombination protein N)